MLNFDPANVHVLLGGIRITGFSADSVVKIEYNTDAYTVMVGADGETARSRSHDQSAKITVSLMPGSTGATALNALQQADRAFNAGVVPIAITDLATGSEYMSQACWVTKDPGRDFKTTLEPMEWVLECDRLESFHQPGIKTQILGVI